MNPDIVIKTAVFIQRFLEVFLRPDYSNGIRIMQKRFYSFSFNNFHCCFCLTICLRIIGWNWLMFNPFFCNISITVGITLYLAVKWNNTLRIYFKHVMGAQIEKIKKHTVAPVICRDRMLKKYSFVALEYF